MHTRSKSEAQSQFALRIVASTPQYSLLNNIIEHSVHCLSSAIVFSPALKRTEHGNGGKLLVSAWKRVNRFYSSPAELILL